jgi:hypothetical protein
MGNALQMSIYRVLGADLKAFAALLGVAFRRVDDRFIRDERDRVVLAYRNAFSASHAQGRVHAEIRALRRLCGHAPAGQGAGGGTDHEQGVAPVYHRTALYEQTNTHFWHPMQSSSSITDFPLTMTTAPGTGHTRTQSLHPTHWEGYTWGLNAAARGRTASVQAAAAVKMIAFLRFIGFFIPRYPLKLIFG